MAIVVRCAPSVALEGVAMGPEPVIGGAHLLCLKRVNLMRMASASSHCCGWLSFERPQGRCVVFIGGIGLDGTLSSNISTIPTTVFASVHIPRAMLVW
jgi:hypothetical protein